MKMCGAFNISPIIPAQAGIQNVTDLTPWIPAFAGMSGGEFGLFKKDSHDASSTR